MVRVDEAGRIHVTSDKAVQDPPSLMDLGNDRDTCKTGQGLIFADTGNALGSGGEGMLPTSSQAVSPSDFAITESERPKSATTGHSAYNADSARRVDSCFRWTAGHRSTVSARL